MSLRRSVSTSSRSSCSRLRFRAAQARPSLLSLCVERGATPRLSGSPPISLQHEAAPVVGRAPTPFSPHLFLCGAQRGGGRHCLRTQHPAIEPTHHLGRGLILD